MIIPDANLLLYAYDSSSLFHQKAKIWWENCLSGNESIGLCEVVVFAFIRISTNKRAFANPLTISEACSHAESWLHQPGCELAYGNTDTTKNALLLLKNAGAGGNLTTDAQIAAVALVHQAIVHTADTDFARFPNVQYRNPILE